MSKTYVFVGGPLDGQVRELVDGCTYIRAAMPRRVDLSWSSVLTHPPFTPTETIGYHRHEYWVQDEDRDLIWRWYEFRCHA